MERKTLLLSECEIKLAGDVGKFSGYASVFNGVDSYGDTILPGAYKDTLATHGMPKMFALHNSYDLPIGKWLTATEDEKGLLVEGELTQNMTRANDVYAALKHGTLDGLSIGYRLKKEDYTPSDKVEGGRVIKKITMLAEISPVTFPADSAARIDMSSVKSDIDVIETIRDFERFLRDAGGLSKGLTEALVSRAKVIFAQGEPDQKAAEAKAAQQVINRIINFKGN